MSFYSNSNVDTRAVHVVQLLLEVLRCRRKRQAQARAAVEVICSVHYARIGKLMALLQYTRDFF